MKHKTLIWIIIFLFNGLASFTHIAGKEAVMSLSPWVVGFYRFLLGAAILWALMKSQGRTITLEPEDRWRFFTLAALAVPINQIFFLLGIYYTPASHPALLYGTTPAWILLITLGLGMERLKWWKWLGIGLSILGVVVLLGGEILTFQKETWIGDALLLVAVLAWSLYTALGKSIVERYGALETTFVVIALGALIYFPVGLVVTVTIGHGGATTSAWLGVLYMGVFTSGLAYYFWYWLLERIRSSQVGIVACAQPPTTALFAWLIFGTIPTISLVLSGVLVLAGIVLMVGYGGTKRGVGEIPSGSEGTL